ncbi:rh50 [Anaeramoeba flamelloides]|uniref:Rh50 n=1 Tax=Anaeramoeba flamelloides TaxID=1746091 RepID=A0ABQ8XJ66_9EUKA|nr:rh50 [Anaeramoeba flamelloides]
MYPKSQKAFQSLFLLFSVFNVVLFGIWFSYPKAENTTTQNDPNILNNYQYIIYFLIVLIFGYGFIISTPRLYTLSGVGFTFFLVSFCIPFALIVLTFFTQNFTSGLERSERITYSLIIESLFATGSVLIAIKGVLGKVTPLQIFLIAILQIILYSTNYCLNVVYFGVIDSGRGMLLHLFSAFFGFTLTSTLTSHVKTIKNPNRNSDNFTDVISLLGTCVLWIFLPSINGAISIRGGKYRATINTIFSICSSTVISFAISALRNNGGVAIASAADLYVTPFMAILVGFISGLLTTFCFNDLRSFLNKTLSIQDGEILLSLHAIPGMISGIVNIIAIEYAHSHQGLYNGAYEFIIPEKGDQTNKQIFALIISIIMPSLGGIVTGWIVTLFTENTSDPYVDEFWARHNEQANSFLKNPIFQDNMTLSTLDNSTSSVSSDDY